MINEREHRMLDELERRMIAEDPAIALRLSGLRPPSSLRAAWRIGTSMPILLVVVAFSVVGFALNVSALGLMFLLWALVGGLRRLVRRRHRGPLLRSGP